MRKWLIGCIFAIAAVGLIIFSGSATTVVGKTPSTSIALVERPNTGLLAPGEQRWFKFKPNSVDPAATEKSLTLIFTPDETARMSFQLFEAEQLHHNLGAGQPVVRDNNPETGELFWTGWLPGQRYYYIELTNSSDTVVDYWLFADNVTGYPLGETPTAANPDSGLPATAPLLWGQNKGGLEPGQEKWYSLTLTDGDDEYFEPLSLTMVATPDDGHRIRHITLEIFTAQAVSGPPLGAGSIVYRDDNPQTGERFWTGWLVEGGLYYVRLHNANEIPIDYWLFTEDLYGPTLN